MAFDDDFSFDFDDYSFTDDDETDDNEDYTYEHLSFDYTIRISPAKPRKFDIDYYDQKNLTKSQLIKFILQDVKENLKNQLLDY